MIKLLTDISSQHIFYLFLLKSAFNHKLIISVYGAAVESRETMQTFRKTVQNTDTEK